MDERNGNHIVDDQMKQQNQIPDAQYGSWQINQPNQPYTNQTYTNQAGSQPQQRWENTHESPYGAPNAAHWGPYQNPQYTPQPPKKKNQWVLWVAVASIAVLSILVLGIAGALVYKVTSNQASPAYGQKGQDGPYSNEFWQRDTDEEVEDDFWKREEREEETSEEGEPAEEEDYNRRDDYVYGISPDADFYSGLEDCINPATDYTIVWEEHSFEDPDTSATFYATYPQIEGENIPNLENLNANLEAYGLELLDYYEQVYAPQASVSTYMDASASAYVTYNDDNKISVVVSENVYTNDTNISYLLCLNIDLINGKLMWNHEILEVSDEFIQEFKKQVELQNNMELRLTEEEIFDYLTEEDYLILFYTPVGLEVGINYFDEYGNLDWLMATFKDYYRYTKSA